MSDHVLLVGEKQNIYDFINASDISVLSTHGEGFSNALMESMALGKPVIATDVGGNASVIGVSGESGFLVPPNSPQSFAETIESLIDDYPRRLEIGRKSQERINNICSLSKYVFSYERLFLNAVNRR